MPITRFNSLGVAYQGTPTDPLVDANQCELDAKAMQSIGTNSIRVYHVDPNANHDGCMSTFHDAGIYVWLDLDTFNTTIVQEDPKWTPEQFYDFARVMDVFQSYENLAGFWIGNEVVFTADGASSAPFVKAAVADMKSYLSSKGYREIPIGYSAADIAELRPMLQNYLACGTKPEEAIDFFGLNSYEWCGDATYETSGYDILNTMSEGYSRPIFFSETGCNVGGSRTFNDQPAIFGPDMVNTWSGSIVYEWVQEANNYGLVTYYNGSIYNGAPIPLSPDFQNLADQWKNTEPVGISESSYSADISPPTCPEASGGWPVDGDVPLPRLKSGIVEGAVATPTSQSSTILSSATSTSAITSNSKVSTTGTDSRSSSPSSTSKPSSSSDLLSSSTSPTSILASAGSTSTRSGPYPLRFLRTIIMLSNGIYFCIAVSLCLTHFFLLGCKALSLTPATVYELSTTVTNTKTR